MKPSHLFVCTQSEEKRYYHSIGIGGTRGFHHREESKLKAKKSNLGKKRSMESRLKMRESAKGNHYHLGHRLSPEQRKRISEGTRAAMADEIVREYLSIATSGENNHNWKGDDFKREYTREFNNWLKVKIRKRDNYTCQLCGLQETSCKHKLAIHHIDYVKENTQCLNLITLCTNCNCRVNTNRIYWKLYFTMLMRLDIWNGGYKHKYLAVDDINNINSKLGKERKPVINGESKPRKKKRNQLELVLV